MDSERPTLLLVDDSRVSRMMSAKLLAQLGYQIVEASDGVEALSLIGKGLRVRCLVLDVMMPTMSGVSLASIARKLIGSDVPIVALTADPSADTAQCLKTAGVWGVLRKPLQKDEFQTLVDSKPLS